MIRWVGNGQIVQPQSPKPVKTNMEINSARRYGFVQRLRAIVRKGGRMAFIRKMRGVRAALVRRSAVTFRVHAGKAYSLFGPCLTPIRRTGEDEADTTHLPLLNSNHDILVIGR